MIRRWNSCNGILDRFSPHELAPAMILCFLELKWKSNHRQTSTLGITRCSLNLKIIPYPSMEYLTCPNNIPYKAFKIAKYNIYLSGKRDKIADQLSYGIGLGLECSECMRKILTRGHSSLLQFLEILGNPSLAAPFSRLDAFRFILLENHFEMHQNSNCPCFVTHFIW